MKAQKLLLLSLASKKLIKMNDEGNIKGEMMMTMTMMNLLVVMIIRSER